MTPDRDATATASREAWLGWRHATTVPEFDVQLRGLYRELDAAIAERGPTCWQSGKCCNFGAYGHRLYVTALEVAWFLGQAGVMLPSVTDSEDLPGISLPQANRSDVCPYQIDGSCSTHAIRPMGCRIFFCQAGTEDWQQLLYETYLERLRRLHEAHGVDYRYADWLALLDEAEASAVFAGD
ncbi:MAG: hypothetical protein AAGH92_09500 [Planctomycetota bacterium]